MGLRRSVSGKASAGSRDLSVDALRGIAIVTMIAANAAAPLLLEPHPFLLRLYGSFAAPLFICLSGMMVAYTSRSRKHSFRHFLARGAMIVLVGVLVDVLIWWIYPFTTVDVLYLIGISAPLAYLFLRLRSSLQWAVLAAIFLVTPFLQALLGYTDFPTELNLLGQVTVVVPNQTGILNHWLVDGWFPIFPWVGFSFLGVTLAGTRWDSKSKWKLARKEVVVAGFSLLVLGAVVWWLYPGSLLVRQGYSELFYPPTIGYTLTAIGVLLLLFSLVDRTVSSRVYQPLRAMGESSLLIYVLHLAMLEYVISPFVQPLETQTFLLVYILLLLVVALIAYGLRAIKTKYRPTSYVVRFLLGG